MDGSSLARRHVQVYSLFRLAPFYSDYADRPSFKWQDTTELEFTNWATGEPNNADNSEACGQMYANGYWNDAPCTKTNVNAYICKRERPTEVRICLFQGFKLQL